MTSASPPSDDPLLVDIDGHAECLLGNEAIVRGALEAGVAFATGYPGTPSSEVTDTFARVAKARGVAFQYAVNEKVALELAFAASIAGARSLCAMKHVGLTYAGDPLATIPYVGTVAGMVIVSAGDPSCHTSSNEQDQRYLGPMLHLPMLDPSTPAEALVMTRAAFEVSERCRLPVVIRPTTRVCHARTVVRYGRLREARVGGFVKDPDRFVPVPPNARRMRREIEQRLETARDGLARFARRTGRGRRGIVACGAPAATCAELIDEQHLGDDVSLLGLGVVYPLPTEAVAQFLEGCDRVLVVEELAPFLEDALRELSDRRKLSVEILGKRTGHLPTPFEYPPERIANAIHDALGVGARHAPAAPAVDVPPRPPILCAGCGHRAAFFAARAALGEDALFFNDIGCYTLGFGAPLDSADALLTMGAGISLAAGVSRVTGKRTVGFVGDSTFFHSGVPPLLDAIKERTSMIAVILDNRVTAMTGFQQSPGVRAGGGEIAREISIEAVVRALGATQVEVVDPYDLRATIQAFTRARDARGVSVIVVDRACPVYDAQVTGRKSYGEAPAVDAPACQGCGRESVGMRCDVPTTRGYERHMARNRSLDVARIGGRPAVAPCATSCPLFLCVQGYAGHVAAGEYAEALGHIAARVSLPESVCRVCEHPCESTCVRATVDEPVAVNDIKRFVVEWARDSGVPYEPARDEDSGLEVAIVGAGPSGLAAAHDLRVRGYSVTLFDANDAPGGLLRTGIPAYRMPREALARDVQRVLSIGVKFVGGRRLGADLRLSELADRYDAVYLAVGAHRPLTLGIQGEAGDGAPMVKSALAFLEEASLGRAASIAGRVAVIGGGNAAIDAARTALRCGASKVTIACIERRQEMPALEEEVRAAEAEGIRLWTAQRPARIVRGERAGVGLVSGELLEAEHVFYAIGQRPDHFLAAGDLAIDRRDDGSVRIDEETCATSHPKVFAGGDVVAGARTVTAAMAWGQRAAWGIDCALRGPSRANRRPPPPKTVASTLQGWVIRADRGARRRAPEGDPVERARSFDEARGRLSEEDARAEAARCLSCGLCGNCNACIELFGCPAMFLAPAKGGGPVRIDPSLCIGCNVCVPLCSDGAIRPAEVRS